MALLASQRRFKWSWAALMYLGGGWPPFLPPEWLGRREGGGVEMVLLAEPDGAELRTKRSGAV